MGKWMRGRRGWLLVTAVAVLAAGGASIWQVFVQGIADGTTQQLTTGELIMKLSGWPLLAAAGMLCIGTAWASVTGDVAAARAGQLALQQEREADARAQEEARDKARHAFAAQVVGVQWLNPLMWRDYPTEWNLLWTLGLAKWNKDDKQAKADPASYSKVQPVAGIAFNLFKNETFNGFFEKYINHIFSKFGSRYFMNGKYFYTVQPKDARDWREVAGMRVEAALPVKLDAAGSAAFIREEINDRFSIGKIDQNLSTSAAPPDVQVTQGGPSAGFTSLSDALDYLEAHPDKTVWVMSFDAPSFPKDTQMNESSVLLILAHPSLKTEREPLAWLHRVSTRHARDFEARSGQSARIVQAWSAALTDAASRGGLSPLQTGCVIHDAGVGSPDGGRRIGALAQALTETLPEFDFQRQTFDTPALLGDLGASTALTDIALGIAYAHHRNTPVVVAGTTDPESATAVLIRPPADPKPFDPDRNWFRARGEGNAYLPWWGRRLDEKRDLMQGWSE